MSIEELIQCDAAKLEAMSDEQYLKWFEENGNLNVTRPERASAVVKRNEQQIMKHNPKLAIGMELLKNLGVDTAGVFAPIRKGKK